MPTSNVATVNNTDNWLGGTLISGAYDWIASSNWSNGVPTSNSDVAIN